MGRRSRILIAVLTVTAVLAACGTGSDSPSAGGGTGSGGSIDLVAYSTPQDAYKAIIAGFGSTDEGKGVTFTESYGASGDQSRAVVAGQPADVVAFSLAPDMDRLVKADLVAADWNADPYKGMVTNSVVVLIVRKGNPKNIKGWDDLLNDGVEVLNPNPFTSGGARWNVMAAYGAQLEQGKTEAQAIQYLNDLYKHVVVQDDSARKSLQTFTGGKGDVLLGYENEAIFAQQKGEDIDYVVPDQTILIENPIAVTANAKNRAAAQAFRSYLFTDAAQKVFADNGYRPVVKSVASGAFPSPRSLFDITKFGGWTEVTAKFFDQKTGIMAAVEAGIGVSVG